MRSGKQPTTTGKSSTPASGSTGGRGAADTGTKKASNAHAAQRQSAKAEANKASNQKKNG